MSCIVGHIMLIFFKNEKYNYFVFHQSPHMILLSKCQCCLAISWATDAFVALRIMCLSAFHPSVCVCLFVRACWNFIVIIATQPTLVTVTLTWTPEWCLSCSTRIQHSILYLHWQLKEVLCSSTVGSVSQSCGLICRYKRFSINWG